jgi:hypothetical protein
MFYILIKLYKFLFTCICQIHLLRGIQVPIESVIKDKIEIDANIYYLLYVKITK